MRGPVENCKPSPSLLLYPRLIKKYSLPFKRSLSSSKTVPGHTMSFSGYPGIIYSGDDFTIASSGKNLYIYVALSIESAVRTIGEVKQQNKMSRHTIYFNTNNVNLLYMYWLNSLPEEQHIWYGSPVCS